MTEAIRAALRTQPFIDCHHHIWEPAHGRHPWLRPDSREPFRYGDTTPLKRTYLPADYDGDAAGFNVVAHVTMEGEWDPEDQVAETAWLADTLSGHRAYVGHVARAWLARPDIEVVLAGHGAWPFVKGIRQKPVTAARPDLVMPGTPGSLSDPAFRRGYAKLQRFGLHYELQAPWWHVDELIDLIMEFPETPIVINHMFTPVDRSEAGLAGWRRALERAASAPQTTLKVSGMGIAGRRWRLDDHRDVIRFAIDTFGPDRCMIASNFPVDGLCGDYPTIIDGYLAATADLDPDARNALFHDTAIRVYRLDVKPLAAPRAQIAC